MPTNDSRALVEKNSKVENDLASSLPSYDVIGVTGCSPLKTIIKRKGGTVAAAKYYDLRWVMRKKLSVAELHNKEWHQKVHEAQIRAEKYRTDLKKFKAG
jgi:lysozyme family protein